MTHQNILITGATGSTGRVTAALALARGHRVRVLAHHADERSQRLQDLGAELVVGDMLDLDAMRAALEGIQGAYFVYPVRPGLVEASVIFAQAAKEAGVGLVANMSQKPARGDAKSRATIAHWLSERVFDWSGVPVTHLRATFFAEWLLYVSGTIRAGIMQMPFGAGCRHAPVAAEDLGRLIVGILENPSPHRGKTYPLFGPVEYNYTEIASVVGGVLGKEIKYEQVSVEEFATAIGQSQNAYFKQHCEAVADDHEHGIFAGTNNLIPEIGGHAQLSLEDFVAKHRAAFV